MNLCGHKRQQVMRLQLSEQSLGWISAPPTVCAWCPLRSAHTAQPSIAKRPCSSCCLSVGRFSSLLKDLISWNPLTEKDRKNSKRLIVSVPQDFTCHLAGCLRLKDSLQSRRHRGRGLICKLHRGRTHLQTHSPGC